MIWLAVYVAGVVLVLVSHGLFGSWQDDGAAAFYAVVWPLIVPVVILRTPIVVTRWLASVGRNAERQDHEDGLGPKDEHAVGSVADETPDV